jgi:WD domain, G-beta repeat
MAVPCIQTLRIDKLSGHFPSLCVFTVPQRLRTLRTETWMAEQQQSSIMTAAQMTAAASGKGEDGENEAPGAGIIGDLIVAAPRMHRITTFPLELAEPPAGALYNEPLMCFVAVMPRDVLLWDTDTGKNANVFVDTSVDAEITCSCFDDRKRKLYLGRQDGSILTINLQNGALMKQGHVHKGSVTAIIYNDEDRCLIAGASDGSLTVYDDEPQAFLDDMRMVTKAHPLDITAVAYSYELSLIITGDREGCIRCWDFQDLKMMADITNAHKSPVTAITAMGPYPYFVSGDGEGKMIVWTSRSHPQPYQCLYTYSNTHVLPEVFDPWEEEEKDRLLANIAATNAANEAQKAANAEKVANAAAGAGAASTPRKGGLTNQASKTNLFVAHEDDGEGDDADQGRRNSVLPEIKIPPIYALGGAGAANPPSREGGKRGVSFAPGADGTPNAGAGGLSPTRQTSNGTGTTGEGGGEGTSTGSPPSGTNSPSGSRPASRDLAIKNAASADSVSRKMKKLMQKTQAKAKAVAALAASANKGGIGGPAGPKNTQAEQEEIMANLNKNMRMTVLVEQIMDDYAQKHAAVEGSFDPYNYHRQRNRKYRLSLTLEDLDDDSDQNPHGIILPPPPAGKRMDARTKAWRQRLRLRSANVPVAVTAMRIIMPEYEDEIEARLEARRKEEEEKEKEKEAEAAAGREGSETDFSWAPASSVTGDGNGSVASKKYKVDPSYH